MAYHICLFQHIQFLAQYATIFPRRPHGLLCTACVFAAALEAGWRVLTGKGGRYSGDVLFGGFRYRGAFVMCRLVVELHVA